MRRVTLFCVLASLLLSGISFATVGDTAWWKEKGPTITDVNKDHVKNWWNSTYDKAPYNSNYDAAAGGNWTQDAEWWADHLEARASFVLHTAGWNVSNYLGWHEIVWEDTAWELGTQSGIVLGPGAGEGSTATVDIPVAQFVFFLGDTSGSNHPNWYTMDSLNPDTYTWDNRNGSDESAPYRHVWTFQDPNPVVAGEQGWVFAFEDVGYPSSGGLTPDHDHDDLVLRMSLSSGGGGSGPPPVPELPPTLLAAGLPLIGLCLRRLRRR